MKINLLSLAYEALDGNFLKLASQFLAGALGFASPGAFLGAAGPTGGAATAPRSVWMRWLPWLFGAAAALFLWSLLGSTASPSASAVPAAAVAAATSVLPAKVYFDVGAATPGAAASQTIATVAESIKNGDLEVRITGYADKSGDLASNEALAKRRAAGVRDALKAAGVAEASMEMKPPMFVEVGAASSNAEARRVDIARQ